MKKDIQIPEVKDVFVAVVHEEHPEYKTLDWNVYIINDGDVDLETVLIVSKGYNATKITQLFVIEFLYYPERVMLKLNAYKKRYLLLIMSLKSLFL